MLCKTLVREENSRSKAFEAALREHELEPYAALLTDLGTGLRAVVAASARMRRSVFLAEYCRYIISMMVIICIHIYIYINT